jgi:hypothetical protein
MILGEERGGLDDPPLRADDCRDASICRPYQIAAVFNRPHNGRGKMLIRGRGLPEPGIIGDVDQEIRSSHSDPSRQIGEDGLEANGHTEPGTGEGKDLHLFPGTEITNPRRQLAEEGKQPSQRYILSEGNQMDLIIFFERILARRKEKGAIEKQDCPLPLKVWTSHQEE